MTNNSKSIPDGYHSVTPYLSINGAAEAIEFYKKAFGAKEIGRLSMGDKKIGHAEIEIGNSRVMLADAFPEWGNKAPGDFGGSPVGLCIYVEDVDAVFKQALEAGAKVDKDMTVKDQFYGDRSGSIIDPFGHKWTIATHIEDVSFAEMQKRSDAMFSEYKAAI
ncbi:MAG: VOC family protein [Bacteroidia bacterium]